MKLGNKLRHLREEQGLTQKDVAEILNVQKSTILNIEKNNIRITVDRLIELSDIYKVEPSDFFEKKYKSKKNVPEGLDDLLYVCSDLSEADLVILKDLAKTLKKAKKKAVSV